MSQACSTHDAAQLSMRLDLACVNNDTVSKRVPLMDPVLQCYQVWVLVGKSIVVVMSMRISLQSHTIIGHAILRWHCSVLWTVLVPLYDKQVFVSSCKHVSAPGALCAVLTRVIRLMLLFLLCACRFACGQWLPDGRTCLCRFSTTMYRRRHGMASTASTYSGRLQQLLRASHRFRHIDLKSRGVPWHHGARLL